MPYFADTVVSGGTVVVGGAVVTGLEVVAVSTGVKVVEVEVSCAGAVVVVLVVGGYPGGAVLEVEEDTDTVEDIEELELLLPEPPTLTSPILIVGALPAQYSLTMRLVTGPPGNVVTVVTVV